MDKQFNTQKELFEHLIANKSILMAEKKATIKQADSISYTIGVIGAVGKLDAAIKEITDPSTFEGDKLQVELIINTTNIMDSHDDVHINGIWTKSLKESKGLLLLQEHQMKFDKVISDTVKASAKSYEWQELGFGAAGSTQALLFKATIDKNRNEFMFKQYLNGYVKEHSVGMRYIKIALAINDKDYKEEYGVYSKYIERIANKEAVEAQGYFYAVTEAKVMEGSAVLKGSNSITPTLTVNEKQEPTKVTQVIEPQLSTQAIQEKIKNYKFKI